MCYNECKRLRKRKRGEKRKSKKFEKPLDKLYEMCYNKDVPKERTKQKRKDLKSMSLNAGKLQELMASYKEEMASLRERLVQFQAEYKKAELELEQLKNEEFLKIAHVLKAADRPLTVPEILKAGKDINLSVPAIHGGLHGIYNWLNANANNVNNRANKISVKTKKCFNGLRIARRRDVTKFVEVDDNYNPVQCGKVRFESKEHTTYEIRD